MDVQFGNYFMWVNFISGFWNSRYRDIVNLGMESGKQELKISFILRVFIKFVCHSQ